MRKPRFVDVIQKIIALDRNDLKRLRECVYCEYFGQCHENVENPEDNPDGSCKTKEEFMRGLR